LEALSQRIAQKRQNAARPTALLFAARAWVYACFARFAAKQTWRTTGRN